MDDNRKKLMFKIILIGEISVGKTSVMRRFVHRTFEGAMKATIGADFMVKEIELGQSSIVTLQIWDTAGGERFQSLGRAFYRGADCCVLVYDITRPQTLERIVNFRDEFLNQTEQDDPKFPFAVVRNKTDLYDEGSSVTEQKSEQYFNEHFGQSTCKHFSTSAKDGSGVEDLFVWIAKTVSQKGDEADNDSYDPEDDRVELRQVEPEEIETKKYNCCKST